MPSRFGFTTTEEIEATILQIRKEEMKISNEVSPAIIDILHDLKKAIRITATISYSISLKVSGAWVTFGRWSIGDEVQIELVTLESDHANFKGLGLIVSTMESIGKDNIKQLNDVLSEVTGVRKRFSDF